MPPSVPVPMLSMTPRSEASSGVPMGAKMSLPSWLRPPERGAPKVLENVCGSATGKTKPVMTISLPASKTCSGEVRGA